MPRSDKAKLAKLLEGPTEAERLTIERDKLLADLERERGKRKAELAESKSIARELARRLEMQERRHDFLDALRDAPNVPRIVTPKSKKADEGAAIALASDWHYEEVVESGTVNGLNHLDRVEAERRVNLFFSKIPSRISVLRHDGLTVKTLVLWLGGDLMTGQLHEYKTWAAPLEAARRLRALIRAGIVYLLEECQVAEIVIPCNYGNHGRSTKEKRIATGAEYSYEANMYADLADELSGEKRIRFEIAGGDKLYLRLFDRLIRFHHGDAISGGGGIGGLAAPMRRKMARWNATIKADLMCVGHFHQMQDYEDVVINGSLKGIDAYANHMGFSAEPPQQQFFSAIKGRDVWRRHRMPIVCS